MAEWTQGDDFMQGPMEDGHGMIRLTGSIEHVIFSNEENGFAICDMGTDTDELITITGTLPYVGEGDLVTVYGRWVHNPKSGRQFKVEQCEKQLPADMDYRAIRGLRLEAAQKLDKIRPLTVGQASRINGVNPADITVLLIYLGMK